MNLTFANWNMNKSMRMVKFSLHLQSDFDLVGKLAGQHPGATTESHTSKHQVVMAVETLEHKDRLQLG